MKVIEKRLNVGYEIQLYYPKENGKMTSQTGNEKEVIQCDNVGEVAQWFAKNSWGSGLYGDSNIANPTVFYNGTPWCRYEDSAIQDDFFYKGFVIKNVDNNWEVHLPEGTSIKICDTYAECIERIDSQTI